MCGEYEEFSLSSEEDITRHHTSIYQMTPYDLFPIISFRSTSYNPITQCLFIDNLQFKYYNYVVLFLKFINHYKTYHHLQIK